MIFSWNVPIKVEQQTPTKLALLLRQPKFLRLYGVSFALTPFISILWISLVKPATYDWFQYVMFACFLLVFFVSGCLIFVLSSQVIICLFDKTLDNVTLKRQSILGTKIIEHSLREIYDVQVEEAEGDDGKASRINLLLTAGEHLPITWFYTYENKQRVLVCIREFLNLPVN